MFLLHKTFHNPVDSSWEIIRNIVEKMFKKQNHETVEEIPPML